MLALVLNPRVRRLYMVRDRIASHTASAKYQLPYFKEDCIILGWLRIDLIGGATHA